MILKPPGISVVIPIYNHWRLVPELLACLAAQTLEQQKFEVLLVENGSDWMPDNPSLPSGIRLLHCHAPGSYAARNEGIRHARGALLAFTDADCQPGQAWLEKGFEYFQKNGDAPAILAGGVSITPLDWKRMTACEIHDVALGLPQARYVQKGIAATANLFVPRKIFEIVGLFDHARFSGGDAEFCRRAARQGVSLGYCEAATVVHPARRNWPELRAKKRRVLGAKITHGRLPRRVKHVVRTLLPPVRLWLYALAAKQLSLNQRLLACGVQTRVWFSEIAELFRLLGGHLPRRN